MSGVGGYESDESDEDFIMLKAIDDEDDEYPSKLYELVIKWQLPVFDATDDVDGQRKKLRESLRIARTPSDHSLPKRNFVALASTLYLKGRTTRTAEIFPPKEVVVQKMRDLLGNLLSPKCQKLGDFILTRKAMRVWKVMEACYYFLMENVAFTEEEVYEVLRHFPRYFPKQSHVGKAINALEKLMQCSRYSFGIGATKAGMIAGPLSIEVNPRNSPLRGYNGCDLPKDPRVLQKPLMPEDEEIVRRLKSWKELDDDYKNELDNMAEMKRKSCTRAVEACYVIRGGCLSAYVLSKVYTDSRNIRRFSKMMNNNTSLQA